MGYAMYYIPPASANSHQYGVSLYNGEKDIGQDLNGGPIVGGSGGDGAHNA